MNQLKSPVDMIRLPSTYEEQNHLVETLKEKFKDVQDPSELDATTQGQDMPASLFNFYLATQVDLSWLGLGKAVHIPVQVTEREGGRKSVYCLDQNEEVLTGIYVTGEGIALSFVKRVTGSSLPAQAGDVYSTRITNRDGELVFERQEKLLKFDPQAGAGQFGPLPSTEHSNVALRAAGIPNEITTRTCFVWSMLNAF
jgi:hypothetical protein